MSIWIWLFTFVIGAISWYVVLYPAQYVPSKVFIEKGELVYIANSPFSRLKSCWATAVPKESIVKIQRVGNCISLFNAHDNAIDINIP